MMVHAESQHAWHCCASQVNQKLPSFHYFSVNHHKLIENWPHEFGVRLDEFIKTLESNNSWFLIEFDELDSFREDIFN